MFHKLAMLTLALMLVGAAMLTLRQRRLELSHDSAELFTEVLRHRRDLWATDARRDELIRPDRLHRRIEQAQLALEPTSVRPQASPDSALAHIEPQALPIEIRLPQ